MPDTGASEIKQSIGVSEKKMETVDRPVYIVTSSGDYTGNINLNLSSVQINRVSDLFVKGAVSFLPIYNATVNGKKGREVIVNTKDIAIVIPQDTLPPPIPELRKSLSVSVKLKYDLGHLVGKVNLLGDSQQSDRLSDLLNTNGKKWLILYDASYKGKNIPAAIINIEFISIVED
jgi:hypothetical protein